MDVEIHLGGFPRHVGSQDKVSCLGGVELFIDMSF